MRILITGTSGFIGFHLSKRFLKNKKYQVLGLDSINNYYSRKIKKLRLNLLKKYKNFKFEKINILNKKKVESSFKKFKPSVVFHIAGQPGVLYSFKNPASYETNNTNVTKIISSISKKYKVERFIFASSSSVYGDQKKFPIKECFKKNPKNYYAKTKVNCEKEIKDKLSASNTKYLIFRFFTVYGPLGRPDMFIHKYLNSIKNNRKIKLHNNGENYRDFTYVDDVTEILFQSLKKNPKDKILNICRSKPIKTTKLVSLINNIYGAKLNLLKTGFVRGEMLKTHGCNKLLKKYFKNIKFIDIEKGLKKTILTFKKYGY